MKTKILLIEDDASTRFGFVRYLSSSGYEVIEARDLSSAIRILALHQFAAVLIDINLPDGSGLDLIETIRQSSKLILIIIITGAGDIPLAVEAMRKGADNFLTKPVKMEELELFLQSSLVEDRFGNRRISRHSAQEKEEIWSGGSTGMKEVLDLARIAAETDSPVLITGETGTGKGVIARWIHNHSSRSGHALVDVNCSGLKGDLLARELFGNVRGAFTSAERDRDGLLDAANKGSLFLDEIGEMGIPVQAQFLKVLEEKTYRRLGDTKVQRSDFRLISATNKQIEQEVQQGAFRSDLYFRINLLAIHIPPLRERSEDIPDMVVRILTSAQVSPSGITDDAMRVLTAYSWPGNVRELKNAIERVIILSPRQTLTPEHFSWLQTSTLDPPRNGMTLREITDSHILSALERYRGDVAKATKSLGISRATFYRRLKNSRGEE